MEAPVPRAELEKIVNDPDAPYFEKGRALEQLLAKNGWRTTHSSEEAYCRAAFSFSSERARQLVAAYGVYMLLRASPTTAAKLPANEAQIRPLTVIPHERQSEAWLYILRNAPGGRITQAYVQGVCQQIAIAPGAPIRFLTADDVPDTAWPSDNDHDIPLLSLRLQAQYCDLPFMCWGGKSRASIAATWHFYTDDARFDNLIEDPTPVVNSRCINAVEPNFSVYGQMPRITGLERIYQKRRIARFWQSQGVRIFVDFNVHPDFYADNLLGVPWGWKAYATRGYVDRINDTIREFELACQRAETNDLLFVVYGGGQEVKKTAQDYGWTWFAEQSDVVRERHITYE